MHDSSMNIDRVNAKPHNKKMLVVYLISSPLSDRDFNRFGVGHWIDKGFNVKVLDFTMLLKPKYWKHFSSDSLSSSFNDVVMIKSIRMMKQFLKNYDDDCIFIDLIDDFSYLEFKIRSIIKKRGTLIQLKMKMFPTYNAAEIGISRYLLKFKRVFADPTIIIRKISTIIRQYLKIASDYLIVSGGSSPINTNHRQTGSIIRVHSFDYDYVLNDKTPNDKLNNYTGILFLDTYAPFHPDKIYSGRKGGLTSGNYYSAINKGLFSLQKELGYDVLIAAHPRSDYNNQNVKYYSFPIVKDETYQLIKQSRIVVSHVSLSLHWAIAMYKPVILVTTDEFFDHNAKLVYIIANALGKKVINLDHIPDNINWVSLLSVDKIKYNKYINNYIRDPNIPEKRVWDIVIDRIENDFQGSTTR